MEVIDEIISWASNQPLWQQSLIAELLSGGNIDDGRIRYYADQAIEESQDPAAYSAKTGNPLEEYDYTGESSGVGVKISEIQATQNINAIPDGSKLPLSKDGLNLIYGDNGSGKSGYTRVLKNSCNCRHNEPLKGDVNSDHERECIATVLFEADGKDESHILEDDSDVNPDLKTVHVFDSKSGHNYLISENELVFMPAGMDILDSLSAAVERVSLLLKGDLQNKTNDLNDLEPGFRDFVGTKAHNLVGRLSEDTALKDFQTQKVLTLDEKQDIPRLEKDTVLRQTKSPQKVRAEVTSRYARLKRLADELKRLQNSLLKSNLEAIIAARDKAIDKKNIAAEAGKMRFENESYIDGTGNNLWKELWEAAQEFSNKSAYPGHSFPHTEKGSKCVLCQQQLSESASLTFKEFVQFVNDKSQSEADKAEVYFKEKLEEFMNSQLTEDIYDNLLDNYSVEDYQDIATLKEVIKVARDEHSRHLKTFKGKTKLEEIGDLTGFYSEITKLDEGVELLCTEIATPVDDDEYRRQLQKDLDHLKNLKSKQALEAYERQILHNIKTHSDRVIIFGAIKTANTFSVSKKIGEVSKQLIIDKMAEAFDSELNEIFRGKITASLAKGRTIKGVPSSAIVLSGKSGEFRGESIEKIMSEGEQRGVALAGFFAELTINPTNSAIVLDDPVTSLDHQNVERIAKRIAKESLKRQVIVFTHNVHFASELKYAVDNLKGQYTAIAIEKISSPGVIRQHLPFDTMPTTQRLDVLEKKINPLRKKFEDNNAEYKSDTENFYRDLRRTWERSIEEVLLGGAVVRYRRDVKPGNVRKIYINEDDKQIIEDNMHNCARYMHDPADESSGNETPTPDNLKEDLLKLQVWVTDLKSRSK